MQEVYGVWPPDQVGDLPWQHPGVPDFPARVADEALTPLFWLVPGPAQPRGKDVADYCLMSLPLLEGSTHRFPFPYPLHL